MQKLKRHIAMSKMVFLFLIAPSFLFASDGPFFAAKPLFLLSPVAIYVLGLVGVWCLLIEFFSPGALVPGALGGLFVFYAAYGLYSLPFHAWALALTMAGLCLIAVSAWRRALWWLAVLGIPSFMIGSYALFPYALNRFRLGWAPIILMTVAQIIVFFSLLKFAANARSRPIRCGVAALIGQQAPVTIDDHGCLWVRLQGQRWQCDSAEQLEAGQIVEVIAVEGLRLQVRFIQQGESV